MTAFERALRGDESALLVAAGDGEKMRRALRVHAPAVATPAAAVPVGPAVAAAAPSSGLAARVEADIKERMAKVVKTDAADLRAQQTFEQSGMDSVMLMELHASLAQDYAGLPKTALFEHDSPAKLAQALLRQHADAVAALFGAAPAPASASPVLPAPAVVAAAPAAQLPPSTKQTAARARREPAVDADAVAIIGMAGEFPQADDLHAFSGTTSSTAATAPA